MSLLSKGNSLVLSPIDLVYLTRILCIDYYPQQTSERLVKNVYKDLLLICQNIFEILFPLFIANVKVVKQEYPLRRRGKSVKTVLTRAWTFCGMLLSADQNKQNHR